MKSLRVFLLWIADMQVPLEPKSVSKARGPPFAMEYISLSSGPQMIKRIIYKPHKERNKVLSQNNQTFSNLSVIMAVQSLEVRPLDGPHPQFGAEIDNVDMERISEEDFEVIRNALYNYHVVVLKNQADVSPKGKTSLQIFFAALVLIEVSSI